MTDAPLPPVPESTPTAGPGVPGSPTPVTKVTHSPAFAVIAIFMAIVGAVLIAYSFLTGIAVALDGSSDGPAIYIALFFIGVALAVLAVIFALVGITRRAHRFLSIVALLIALLPALGVLVIAALLFLG
jgi:hypothetical protein